MKNTNYKELHKIEQDYRL